MHVRLYYHNGSTTNGMLVRQHCIHLKMRLAIILLLSCSKQQAASIQHRLLQLALRTCSTHTFLGVLMLLGVGACCTIARSSNAS
jgi:hypothetical protein